MSENPIFNPERIKIGAGKFTAGKIVFGGFFGDEGKGKIVDITCSDYKKNGYKILSIRGQGSGNAGHTVEVNGKKMFFHYLTSAGMEADIMLLGAGMLIDPVRLLDEIKQLPENKQAIVLIDERAMLCCDLDRKLDEWIENETRSTGKRTIGTTKSGVGPATALRALRQHPTFADVKSCKSKEDLYKIIMNRPLVPMRIMSSMTMEYAGKLFEAVNQLSIVNGLEIISNCREEGYAVLLEVSQAVLLDPLFGNGGHFVTSTPTTDIGAAAGAGLKLDDFPEGSTMVLKAYSSKVGGGPFPTKFKEDEAAIADVIYRIVGECGVTTGRKRDLGWFDAVGVRHSLMLSNCREIAINCMDLIPKLAKATDKIKVCYAYRKKETDEVTYMWPYDLSKYEPLYIELSMTEKTDEQIIDDYIHLVSTVIGRKIDYIGLGPGREDIRKL